MAPYPPYHINVFWHPDAACWIADVPDLRLCSAKGVSPQSAVAGVQGAIEQWIETALAIGQPVPEPRYSPAIHARH